MAIPRPGPTDHQDSPGLELDVLFNAVCDLAEATDVAAAAHISATAPHSGHSTPASVAMAVSGHNSDVLAHTGLFVLTSELKSDLAGLINQTPRKNTIIAHRSGSQMRVEGLLASYIEAFNLGFKNIDLDVQFLADGSLCVIHDTTVDALTTSTGNVSALTREQFKALSVDAGTWRNASDGMDLKLAMFDEICNYFADKDVVLWVEGKVADATSAAAAMLRKYGYAADKAVIQSTSTSELVTSKMLGYKTCLLGTTWAGGFSSIAAAGVTWVGGITSSWVDNSTVAAAKAQGLKTAVYTLYRRHEFDTYSAMGIDAFWCDSPEYIENVAPVSAVDLFSMRTYAPGMILNVGDAGPKWRGQFFSGRYYGWADSDAGYWGALQGWACPIKSNANCDSFTITFDFVRTAETNTSRWLALFVCANTDKQFTDGGIGPPGYHCLIRGTSLDIYRVPASGISSQIATTSISPALTLSATYTAVLTVTPTTVALSIPALSKTVTATDSTSRGGYFSMGRDGVAVKVRNMSIT